MKKAPPWIWIVIAQLAFIAALTTLVVIAVEHPQPEVVAGHDHD
jgi:hypothetical protein